MCQGTETKLPSQKDATQEVKRMIDFDWILDIAKTEPVFSRKRLHAIIEIYERVKDHGGPYALVDLLGGKREFEAEPNYWVEKESGNSFEMKIAVGYRSYQDMADEGDLARYGHRRPFSFVICHVSDYRHACDGIDSQLKDWEKEWEKSKYREVLAQHLRKHASQMIEVRRIVCFGLGHIGRYRNGSQSGRSYIQHLAACTVREILEQQQAIIHEQPAPQQIKIYAQDPTYCDNCKATLKEKHRIEVVENPYGFVKIDKNTFVLSFSPDVPVRQIIADLSLEYRGPAGMLCNGIESDGLNYAVRSFNDDLHAFMSSYTTDPDSPNLAKYRDECTVLNLNDQELPYERQSFGRTALYLKQR